MKTKKIIIYLQRDLPGPGVRSGLVSRYNPFSHIGLEVRHSTIFGPVYEEISKNVISNGRVLVHS